MRRDSPERQVQRFADLDSLSQAAAAKVQELATTAVKQRGRFTLVLSGGSTPRRLYEKLAAAPFASSMPWQQIFIFFGDERCVPADHPESNYGMAHNFMLGKLSLATEQVLRMRGELDPQVAANEYERRLRDFFVVQNSQPPSFDLILLGMGADGHTASLFPDSAALHEQQRWVVSVPAPETMAVRWRLTLTLPLINRARCVLFLLSGKKKGEVARALFNQPREAAKRYPAARVQPEGQLLWYVDATI